MEQSSRVESEVATLLSSISLQASMPDGNERSFERGSERSSHSIQHQRHQNSNFDDLLSTIKDSGAPSIIIPEVGFRTTPTSSRNVYSLGGGLTSEVAMHAVNGHFGWTIEAASNRTVVALKVFKVSTPSPKDRETVYGHIIRELKVLSHPCLLGHPNLVALLFIGWSADSPYPMIATELGTHGSLDYIIKMPGSTPTGLQKRHVTLDIASGLHAIHQAGFVHGDIKPENIIVSAYPNSRRDLIAKIADFGGSVEVQDHTNPVHFTRIWCAPELIIPFSDTTSDWRKADIYTYGLVVASLWAKCPDRGSYGGGRLINPSSCFLSAFIPHPDTEGMGEDIITLMKCDTESNRVLSALEQRLDTIAPDDKSMIMYILTPILQVDPAKRPEQLIDLLDNLASITGRNLIQETLDSLNSPKSPDRARASRPRSRLWPEFLVRGRDTKKIIAQRCEEDIRSIYSQSQVIGISESSDTVEHLYAIAKQVDDIAEDDAQWSQDLIFSVLFNAALQGISPWMQPISNAADGHRDILVPTRLAKYMAALEFESISANNDDVLRSYKWMHIAASQGIEECVYMAPFLFMGSKLESQFPLRLNLCLLTLSGSHMALQCLADRWPGGFKTIQEIMRKFSRAFLHASTSDPGLLFGKACPLYLQALHDVEYCKQDNDEFPLSLEDAFKIGAIEEIEQHIQTMAKEDCKTLLFKLAQSRLSDAEATTLARLSVLQGAHLQLFSKCLIPDAPVELYAISTNFQGSALSWSILRGKKRLALEIFRLHVEHDTPIPDFLAALMLSAVFLYHELLDALLLLKQDNPSVCEADPAQRPILTEFFQALLCMLIELTAETETSLGPIDQVLQQKIRHGPDWRTARKATLETLLTWGGRLSIYLAIQRDDVDALQLIIENKQRSMRENEEFSWTVAFFDPWILERENEPMVFGDITMSLPLLPIWSVTISEDAQHCFSFLLHSFPGCLSDKIVCWQGGPLHFACSSPNILYVRSLLESGSDWKALDERGFTPLVHALARRNIKAADMINSYAQRDNHDAFTGCVGYWQSPIWFDWVRQRDLRFIESFRWIVRHSKLHFFIKAPTSIVYIPGREEIMPLLSFLLYRPRPMQEFDQRCDLEMMEFLLSLEDFSSQINTCEFRSMLPLHLAASFGHVQIVQMLLHRREVNVGVKAPLAFFPFTFFCESLWELTAVDFATLKFNTPEPLEISSGGSIAVYNWYNDLHMIIQLFKATGARRVLGDSEASKKVYQLMTVFFYPKTEAPDEENRKNSHPRIQSPIDSFEFGGEWPKRLSEIGVVKGDPSSSQTAGGRDTEPPIFSQTDIETLKLVETIGHFAQMVGGRDSTPPLLSQVDIETLTSRTRQHHGKNALGFSYQESSKEEEPWPVNAAAETERDAFSPAGRGTLGQDKPQVRWWQEESRRILRDVLEYMKRSRLQRAHEHKRKGREKELVEDVPHTDSLAKKLRDTILSGNFVDVKSILKQGVSFEAEDSLGLTPLHVAIMERKPEIVDLLLEEKADPNHPLPLGLVPLHLAVAFHSVPMTEALLNAGADLQGMPQSIATPLQYALAQKFEDVLYCISKRSRSMEGLDSLNTQALILKLRKMTEALGTLMLRYNATKFRPDVYPFSLRNYDDDFH